jgi:hypothetical protein
MTSYVLQARSPANSKGYVFLNCNFTAESGRGSDTVYFARTGGAGNVSSNWDNVAIVTSRVDTLKYKDAGWDDDDGRTVTPAKGTANTGWREYGNVKASDGSPVDTTNRHQASYVMTEEEYNAGYKRRNLIVAGSPLASLVDP